MTETLTGTDRSAGMTYGEMLQQDTRPVPQHLLDESPMPPGDMRVPAVVYYDKTFHDFEIEHLWKRVWQLACHEDELANVGDYVTYDVANLSFLLVRTGEGPDDIAAHRNACLHRGRKLRECDGKGAKMLRCAFHGWSWKLDGAMNEIPCQWDFPSVDMNDYGLPEAMVARWGGLVFINPDSDAEPFETWLGDFPKVMETLPQERRFKAVHVRKKMRVNWKTCQEAFMEAYHSVATHPTLMETLGDANTRYDVFGNYSRAVSPTAVRSPHLAGKPAYEPVPDGRQYARYRHPMSGHIYERAGENLVHIIEESGNVSVFDESGNWIEGEMTQADPHLCMWVGGPQVPGFEDVPINIVDPPNGMTSREYAAEKRRAELRRTMGAQLEFVDPDAICDAELIDAIYYSVFPNWHPWGPFNALNYRFRPLSDDPNECLFEVMLFAASPTEDRPPPARPIDLDFDEDWTDVAGLGPLAKIFQQDSLNLPWVQQGMKNIESGELVFGNYNESKIRHFHEQYQRWLGVDYKAILEGTSVEVRKPAGT